MDFDEYQTRASETSAAPPKLDGQMYYFSLGLAGEVGELLNKIKKIARDGKNPSKEDITGELGDVLWYLSQIAKEFDIPLSEVVDYNIKKLASRRERGVISGSGDER
ncbi:MAG TPA: nucleoside triphosphate pyrophosphohydrolase family protein [Candidatus Baltobacteraceae bacterium]|nr:nucleoside triphosphate pyrophosphohydrolase family protein [Candidatus Baltobacteraceae bacterium]